MGLPAIWTFAAVIIGGGLFGVIGMVLFIPVFSVFYTILSANVNRRLGVRGIAVDEVETVRSEKPTYDYFTFDWLRRLTKKFTRMAEDAEDEIDGTPEAEDEGENKTE